MFIHINGMRYNRAHDLDKKIWKVVNLAQITKEGI